MRKIVVTAVLLGLAAIAFSQNRTDVWAMFAKTKFESKYFENMGEYMFIPTFSEELRNMEGKELTLQGYYVPFAPEDGDYIIVSKFPMSQCYYCGGGGPESIAEVVFATTDQKFAVDDLITIKGKLKLNKDDLEHAYFIVKDAVLVKK